MAAPPAPPGGSDPRAPRGDTPGDKATPAHSSALHPQGFSTSRFVGVRPSFYFSCFLRFYPELGQRLGASQDVPRLGPDTRRCSRTARQGQEVPLGTKRGTGKGLVAPGGT